MPSPFICWKEKIVNTIPTGSRFVFCKENCIKRGTKGIQSACIEKPFKKGGLYTCLFSLFSNRVEGKGFVG